MYRMNKIEWTGYLAVFLGVISFFPVIQNIYKTKKTNNFPYKSILLALTAHACWFIYGLYTDTSATEYSGIIFILMYLFILYIKKNN